ncbi:hypothetical protein DW322_13350 [Rhodococcus rhodnii]|uniref:2-isopropylmalate synthase LeuA allosteric (dimerisation) domain-containing protein n=2 Tax=Rhodococcus rhodnii TaxID=38312 RepID=R7WPG0_9NOCA|nr:hypothetical protein [Rhodococcus rhodnii]EOM75859.1 hypothetical protein Rrhod_2765 [Rhodococcus rhodnii LMG 5362]TXG91032.1 hypothetical protein DW322_13350 [Rhodococcus rhodnii]
MPIADLLPRGLRDEARCTDRESLRRTYCPAGPFALLSWRSRGAAAGSTRYEAELTTARGRRCGEATATGPLAALTAMLHDAGTRIEILEFHQRPDGGRHSTSVRCESNGRTLWAFADDEDRTRSALGALLAAANRFAALPEA